jgi:hypothetical protein
MGIQPDRWEQGSEHSFPAVAALARVSSAPWRRGRFLFSGRDALRLLLDHGAVQRGWRRLWVPDYFCQTVVAAMRHPRIDLRVYADDPLREVPEWPDARRSDAIFSVNYFGLRGPTPAPRRDGVEVIEDHTHDPASAWARRSTADFCVVSLRKTLPISDGASLWSPRGHALPPPAPLDRQRRAAAHTVLSAMILKAMYLAGYPVKKDLYRALAVQGERELGAPGMAEMSDLSRVLLQGLPEDRWRRARARNHGLLREGLARLGWARVLLPATAGAVPFSCVLEVDSATRRERLRRRLIAARIYPAVLWPLEEPVVRIGAQALALSRRLLSVHCDARYGPADMRRVADLVARSGER